MKHNKMMKHILPVLLAAMVAFSSLGLGSLAPLVQAEEAAVGTFQEKPYGSVPIWILVHIVGQESAVLMVFLMGVAS